MQVMLNLAAVVRAIMAFSLGLIFILFSSNSQALADSCNDLHMGITLPLTGPGAAYGVAARNGFELARRANPEAFSNITFHYEDSQLKPAQAVQAFSALRSRFRIWTHFDFGSATSLALAPIAEKAQIPMFSSAYDPEVSRGRRYVIRYANSTADYAQKLLDELRLRKIRRLAVVVVDNPFFAQYVDTLQSMLRSEELLTIFKVDSAESDFGTLAIKLNSRSCEYDGLGLFLFHEQSRQLLRRLNAKKSFANIFGSDALEEASNSTKDDEIFKGIFFANSRVVPEFIRLYQDTYSSIQHHTFAAGTFDLANLLLEAARIKQACTKEKLLAFAKTVVPRAGPLGFIEFKESTRTGGYFASEIIIKDATTHLKRL